MRMKKKRRIVKSISWFIFVYLHQFTKRLLPMFSLVSNSNLNGYLHHFFHSTALPLDMRWSLPFYASWCVSSFLHTIQRYLIAWGYIERMVRALVTFPHIHTHRTELCVYAQLSSAAVCQHIKIYLNRCETVKQLSPVIGLFQMTCKFTSILFDVGASWKRIEKC